LRALKNNFWTYLELFSHLKQIQKKRENLSYRAKHQGPASSRTCILPSPATWPTEAHLGQRPQSFLAWHGRHRRQGILGVRATPRRPTHAPILLEI
jgi:hypothetical protein